MWGCARNVAHGSLDGSAAGLHCTRSGLHKKLQAELQLEIAAHLMESSSCSSSSSSSAIDRSISCSFLQQEEGPAHEGRQQGGQPVRGRQGGWPADTEVCRRVQQWVPVQPQTLPAGLYASDNRCTHP